MEQLIEILQTNARENASQGVIYAYNCIITALADPDTFFLDSLLSLEPIRILKGELIHDLLTIFAYEKLPAYLTFYKQLKEFVNFVGKIIFLLYIYI